MRHRRLFLLVALAATGCHGPALHVANPDGHPVFLDGVRLTAASDGTHTLPYRYYGTTRWDALPKDLDGDADWVLLPASTSVTIPPPANPLLFPLDLPIEIVSWLLYGQAPTTTTVVLPRTDAAELAATAQGNNQLSAVRQRAQGARASR